jgi:SNF2 family DNA or RNA helicase
MIVHSAVHIYLQPTLYTALLNRELKLILESTIMIRRLKEQVLGDLLPQKKREVVLVDVAKEMQADIAALLQQKKDVSTALLDTTRSAQSLANLKQDQQVLTTRLCKLTGMAKVKGVINHLKKLITADTDTDKRNSSSDSSSSNSSSMYAMTPSSRAAKGNVASTTGSSTHATTDHSASSGSSGSSSTTAVKRKRDDTADDTDDAPATQQQWSCEMCTLVNTAGTTVCSVCDTPKRTQQRQQQQGTNTSAYTISDNSDADDSCSDNDSNEDAIVSSSSKKANNSMNSNSNSSAKSLQMCVFAHHKEVLDAIEHAMKMSDIVIVRIDGDTPKNKRAGIVEKFQTDDTVQIILLGITAAGVGITLTKGSLAVFAELYWTPG